MTGASSGIGWATARGLHDLGALVFATVRQIDDATRITDCGMDRIKPILLDITNAGQIARAAEQVADQVPGALCGLVNNAGIVVSGPLEFLSLDRLREQFEVNVYGQIAVTQAFLPLLRQGRGRIVNVGSLNGKVAVPFTGPYSASKFSMEALTVALREELRPWRIPVSIVTAGNVNTPLWGKSLDLAEQVRQELPDRARDLYGSAIESVVSAMQRQRGRGIMPEVAARTVIGALTAKRPRRRYTVGVDAKCVSWALRLLPDGVLDWLIRRQLGLR